ncbi:MAG: hypothetical protein R3E68_21690 [Burkholderiaceae bacterium]
MSSLPPEDFVDCCLASRDTVLRGFDIGQATNRCGVRVVDVGLPLGDAS